jgi:hypothetical protein
LGRLPREHEESHEGSQDIMDEHSTTIREGYRQRPTAADHDTKNPAISSLQDFAMDVVVIDIADTICL